ncbi:MAG: 4Fe-4S dicluster domain-containing protein [Desulfobacteraceae bacterium]|nr:4Fe-4S dicluster domain-containing protein [Desulfobacteraceae bacterium]
MFYTISLYASLSIFSIGLLYKITGWFRHRLGRGERQISTAQRIAAAVKGILKTLFSAKVLVLLKVFLLDVLWQHWLLKKRFSRWLAHILIYGGFMLLLLMHGLEKIIAPHLFSDYYSTLNPFMFLRNLFSLMILVGLAMAVFRRWFSSAARPKSTGVDHYAILILAIIMISGIVLEAVKITSFNSFEMMASDYASLSKDDTDEFNALASYWVQFYGVAAPELKPPFDAAVLQQGEELHQASCMQCHSRPQWAFISYPASRALFPAATLLDQIDAPTLLWYLHLIACFAGLAYLPFSKFFHIVASPLFLMAAGVMKAEKSLPANVTTLKVLALDACTHCGECTTRCSVAAAYNEIPNPGILPSEKLAAFRRLLSGGRLSKQKLLQIQEASHICTDCRRCTDICPMGINLEALWADLKTLVADFGFPKPEAWARKEASAETAVAHSLDQVVTISPDGNAFMKEVAWTPQADTFHSCFECRNCTNVCPVVGSYESPRKVLGLLPHEIMHYLALKQKEPVLGAAMLWACTTCYACQEQCPQGVNITDLFYRLKNLALRQLQQEA